MRLNGRKLEFPNTYVIVFAVIVMAAVATALFRGFEKQAGIIAFILIIGGSFWIVNSVKAVDAGNCRTG